MKKLITFICTICMLIQISCKDNKTNTKSETVFDEQEMIDYFNSFNPKWRKAIRENDASYIIERYDDHAIIGPANKEFIIGKDAITKYWNNSVNFLEDFSYITQKIGGNPDDIIFENGISYVTYTINNVQIRDTSKYLFVWKHVGNRDYKVLSEMFNASK